MTKNKTYNIEKPKQKELLFSVTKDQFKVSFFTSGGPGGQHQNKTASACRIVHPASGATGESREHKDQLQNKKAAFKRLTETDIFKKWLKTETAKYNGELAERERRIQQQVDEWMKPENLKIEYLGEQEEN